MKGLSISSFSSSFFLSDCAVENETVVSNTELFEIRKSSPFLSKWAFMSSSIFSNDGLSCANKAPNSYRSLARTKRLRILSSAPDLTRFMNTLRGSVLSVGTAHIPRMRIFEE